MNFLQFTIYLNMCARACIYLLIYYIIDIAEIAAYTRGTITRDLVAKPTACACASRGHGRCTADASSL